LKSRVQSHTVLKLAVLVASVMPAFATIQLSYCEVGCPKADSGITYPAFQAVTSGLTFPATPIALGGLYTDATTGAIVTRFNNTTQEALLVNGADAPKSVSAVKIGPFTYAITLSLSPDSSSARSYAGVDTTLMAFHANGGEFDLSASRGSKIFFGRVSAAPPPVTALEQESFRRPRGPLLDLAAGPAEDIPEASTFALIGGGLLMFRFLRKPAFRRGPVRIP